MIHIKHLPTLRRLAALLLVAAAPLLTHSAHAQAKAAPPAEPKPAAAAPAVPGDAILGEWWTENNEGRIRFTRDKEGFYRGTTTCCQHSADDKNNPAIDIHNPKPELRNRSTLGIVLIWKLKYEDGEYVDGYVYNPRDGKTYRMKMEVLDKETLQIRGYMGIALLGQTQIWKRAHVTSQTASPTAAAH